MITNSSRSIGRRYLLGAGPSSNQRGICRSPCYTYSTKSLRRSRSSLQKEQHASLSISPEHAFDLKLAVSLAGAAFEAYLEPMGAIGCPEVSVNKTRTTYTDRSFLCSLYQGVLQVELLRGTGLRVADITGTSDPYVLLSVGGSSARSKTVMMNVNPTWNEKFTLYVRDISQDVLKVRVFDQDFLSSDDDLGVIMQPLAGLRPGEVQELTLTLKGAGAQGSVTVRLTFLEMTGNLVDSLMALEAGAPSRSVPNLASTVAAMTGADKAKLASGPPLVQNITNLADAVSQTLEGMSRLLPQSAAQPPASGEAGASESPAPSAVQTESWQALASAVGYALGGGNFVPVAYVDNDTFDTQCWIFLCRERREIMVAFRGTEQVKWKDLATDLNLVPSPLNPERVDESSGLPLPLKLLKGLMPNADVMVHSGFLNAYDAVRQQVVRLVEAALGGDGVARPWRVLVTGHSLGGALATLAAYELAERWRHARRDVRVAMYSFGAPRVGNVAFAAEYDRAVPNSWRITNSNDIIPSIPRLMGYCHVGHSVLLSPGSRVLLQRGGADIFGEGKSHSEVIGELVEKVATQSIPWDEVYSEIAAKEMEVFNSLVSGQALEEHMETFYLHALKEAVTNELGVNVELPKK